MVIAAMFFTLNCFDLIGHNIKILLAVFATGSHMLIAAMFFTLNCFDLIGHNIKILLAVFFLQQEAT